METVILEWMKSNSPLLFIMVGVVWIVWKLSKLYHAFDKRTSKNEDSVNKLNSEITDLKGDVKDVKKDITDLKQDVSGLKVDVSGLKVDVAELKANVSGLKTNVAGLQVDVSGLKANVAGLTTDMDIVKGILGKKFRNTAMIMSMKHSPRRLNPTGEWLLKEIDGKRFLQDNKDFFFAKIDSMKPKTALDVENAANFACVGYTDMDIFNGMKNYVYNAPTIHITTYDNKERPYDLSMDDVCFVLSLPLRDMYLTEHPEITKG